MIPWIQLASAAVPGSDNQLRLMRRGSEFSIMIGGNELMNSRLSGSEEDLARLAAARLGPRTATRVLIGGLGMGFTLRAALAAFGDGAQVTVAELVPAVVAWARGPMVEVFGGSLEDPRVTILEADVGRVIGAAREAYDVVLLDVDNGPDGLTSAGNDALYGQAGLAAARRALRRDGILGIWSCGPNPSFARRFEKAGFEVDEISVRAGRGRGTRHTLWFGRKGA